jgi:predicted transcriptional regulator YdeE
VLGLVVAGLAATLAPGAAGEDEGIRMNPRVSQVQGFAVVGITGRTNNAKEMTPAGIIGKLWGQLMQGNLLTKIPNRADENILAVYTDYASDKNGDYTFILGAKVSQDSEIPAGMVTAKVATGKYADFTSERGPANRVVPEIWQKINSLPRNVPGGDRAYQSDFEVYDQRARNPQDAIVDVFVGIR